MPNVICRYDNYIRLVHSKIHVPKENSEGSDHMHAFWPFCTLMLPALLDPNIFNNFKIDTKFVFSLKMMVWA